MGTGTIDGVYVTITEEAERKNTRGFRCGLLSRQFYFASLEEIFKGVDE